MSTYGLIAGAVAVIVVLGGGGLWLIARLARKQGEAEGVVKGAAALEKRAGEANAIEDAVHDLDPAARERLLNRRD